MIASEPVRKEAPASGEHWYARDGSPFYTMRGKNGNLRAVTIRDARKVGAVPSVTTVLGVLAKPALTTWMVNQGILAALTLPRVESESEQEYIRRVVEDSKAQGKAAAEEGTRIHDAIEQSFKGQPVPPAYVKHVEATRTRIALLFPDVSDWRAEDSFCHASGFGGKVDLHSPSTGIVIDYKSTDEKEGSGKRFHYDQNWQLAAYQIGLCLPFSTCANIFVSRSEPGTVFSHVWPDADIASGADVFMATLDVWKAIKQYNPAEVLAQAA